LLLLLLLLRHLLPLHLLLTLQYEPLLHLDLLLPLSLHLRCHLLLGLHLRLHLGILHLRVLHLGIWWLLHSWDRLRHPLLRQLLSSLLSHKVVHWPTDHTLRILNIENKAAAR
jgi:hypothetical protein